MMKQTCKRLTALLLALSMCLSLLCSNAWAADMTETHGDAVEAVAANETDPGIEEVTPELDEEFAAAGICGEHLTWTLDDAGTLTISGTGAMTNWGYYSNAPWHADKSIKAVIIEAGVTSIGDYAFEFCDSITNITIPDSVTSIGEGSLFACKSLTSFTIPGSVTSIGEGAFGQCSGLTSVVITNGVINIGEGAFISCTSLTSITVPDSVTGIGEVAFYECTSLTDVYYEGTEEQWSKIGIGTDNDPLTSAVIHFKSATPDCGGNHTWDSGEVTKAATCKAAGTKTFTCTVCGETKTETIPKTAHTIVTDKAVAATCTTAGKTAGKHCSVCNTVTVAQTSVPAKGHSYGAWVTTKQPTATTTGTKERTCSACGSKETQVIPVVYHTHSYTSAVTKAATCAATGVRTYTCFCGDSYTETIAKTAHTWDAGKVTKAATATAEGEKTFTCTVCKTTKTETIAKLKANTITAADVTKNASTKEQSIALNAKASAGTLKYKSDNDKITIKDGKAVVPANFTGKANITITASGSGYATATKTIVLTINKVANTKIGTVITKDMSRVGRNYLEVGLFTEVYFGKCGVRFIAIDNGVDTIDQQTVDFLPIMNLINEWYVKDFSERMKSAWKAKRIAGLHTCTVGLYGYKKDEQNPDKWVIDEPAAAVVRHIFQLALEGKKPRAIANTLFKEQIEKPSYYRAKHAPNGYNFQLPERPYDWDESVVRTMLTSEEYMGWTVNHKKIRPTYKKRITQKVDRSEWQFVEGTQEPIISEEIFEKVQSMLTRGEPTIRFDYTNPLKGLIFCADCGEEMKNKRQKPQPQKKSNGEPNGRYTKPLDCFECKTYTIAKRHHENKCSRHMIRSDALNFLILESLKSYSSLASSDRNALIQQLNGTDNDALKAALKERSQKQKRSEQLDDLIQNAYEANFKGNLTDKRLETLVSKYEAEQERLEKEIHSLNEQIESEQKQKPDSRRFLNALSRFTDFSELTADMVSELVEKVVVHDRVGSRSKYEQEVEIYFKFAGRVQITSGTGGEAV